MILLIALLTLMVISSLISSFTGKIQATTFYVGKLLGNPDFATDMPNGYQDAITPEFQNKLNIIVPATWILILVVGSFITWWGGILALAVTMLVLNTIVDRTIPQRLSYYVMMIMNDMANRIADYKKEKDESRADAGQEMYNMLSKYYLTIKDTNTPVPKFRDIKTMPVGGGEN